MSIPASKPPVNVTGPPALRSTPSSTVNWHLMSTTDGRVEAEPRDDLRDDDAAAGDERVREDDDRDAELRLEERARLPFPSASVFLIWKLHSRSQWCLD